MKKLNEVSSVLSCLAAVLFGIGQELILFGFVAAWFPRSAPYAMIIASNGSCVSVLLNIAVYHLEILDYISGYVLGISWGVLSGLLISFWYMSAQDLTVRRLLLGN